MGLQAGQSKLQDGRRKLQTNAGDERGYLAMVSGSLAVQQQDANGASAFQDDDDQILAVAKVFQKHFVL